MRCRGDVAQRRMRALIIAVADRGSHLCAGVVDVEEQRLIEKLVAHAAVEALDEAVLHPLAGRDDVPVDVVGPALLLDNGYSPVWRGSMPVNRRVADGRSLWGRRMTGVVYAG
jgi:hypothetical protein